MSTTSVEGTATVTGYIDSKNRKTGGSLGKDDFLKLLVTQMSHQDPLNPQQDTQFIAQMAQFTSLEQMQNLNQSNQIQTASAMIGKQVKAEVMGDDGTERIYGLVISSAKKDGEMYVNLDNGRQVKIEEVKNILSDQGLYQEAQSLVGEQVMVRKYDTSGSTTGTKTVVIKNVTVDQQGNIILNTTGGEQFGMKDVFNVAPDEGKV